MQIDRHVLRVMRDDDVERVRYWRNLERVRRNMYTDHLISDDEHRAWFESVRDRPDTRLLIYEEESIPIGFVSFTGINIRDQRATWAFYIGAESVRRGAGSRMEFLALDYAFDSLALRKLTCEVLAFNHSVVKMHRKFGFVEEGVLREHVRKSDRFEDVIQLAIFSNMWKEQRSRLRPLCFGD